MDEIHPYYHKKMDNINLLFSRHVPKVHKVLWYELHLLLVGYHICHSTRNTFMMDQ